MGDQASYRDEPRAGQGGEPLVVMVAGSVEERVRVLTRLGDAAPLLLVSSAEEAAAVLAGAPTGAGATREPGSGDDDPGPPRTAWREPSQLGLVEDRRAVRVGGTEVSLTPLEFGVLRCLLVARGEVRSFGQLSREVWDTPHVGDGSQVHAVVKRLRRKLAAVDAPVSIQVVRGAGFRAVPTRQLEVVPTAVTS